LNSLQSQHEMTFTTYLPYLSNLIHISGWSRLFNEGTDDFKIPEAHWNTYKSIELYYKSIMFGHKVAWLSDSHDFSFHHVLSVKCVLLNLRKECVTVSMDIYRNPVNLRNVSLCVGRKRERFLINCIDGCSVRCSFGWQSWIYWQKESHWTC